MRPYQGDIFAFCSERRYFIRWAFKLITDICSQREYTLLDETSHERIEVMWGELYCLGWIQLLNLTEKELDIMAYFLWQRMKCRKINIPDMARIWIVLYSPPQKKSLLFTWYLKALRSNFFPQSHQEQVTDPSEVSSINKICH